MEGRVSPQFIDLPWPNPLLRYGNPQDHLRHYRDTLTVLYSVTPYPVVLGLSGEAIPM